VSLSKNPRPKNHASKEGLPSIGSKLVRSYLKIVKHLPHHSRKWEPEACLKHIFVHTDFMLVFMNHRALILRIEMQLYRRWNGVCFAKSRFVSTSYLDFPKPWVRGVHNIGNISFFLAHYRERLKSKALRNREVL
jgi:hypothetical protein